MTLGPTIIYQCPACAILMYKTGFSSTNTIMAFTYSDGKTMGTKTGRFPSITKCPKCKTIFWLSKSKQMGEYYHYEEMIKDWKNAVHIDFPDLYDYNDTLNKGVYDSPDEEVFLRQQIWWAFNDRLRKEEQMFLSEDDKAIWTENIYRLLNLLSIENINHRMLIAELHRNLGNFQRSIGILMSMDDPETQQVKEILLKECDKKNRNVVNLNSRFNKAAL